MTLYDVLSDEVEVVVVGLGRGLSEEVPALVTADDLAIASFDSTYKAFRYLEIEGGHAGDGMAVICDADALALEGFLFVHQIRRDPKLRNVPIIALDRTGKQDGRRFLRAGVDDCYQTPVDWSILKTRITQIREYRLLLDDGGQEPFETEDSFALPAREARLRYRLLARGHRVFYAPDARDRPRDPPELSRADPL